MWGQKELYPGRTSIALAIVFACAVTFLNVPSSSVSAASAETYYSMGQGYMEKGKFDMASLAFEKAVKLSPDWPEAHNALGEVYVQLLRFEDAVTEFNKAIELKRDYTQAKINRRRAMMSVERYEPIKGSKLNHWHKAAILGGVTVAVTLISALVIHLSS